MIEPTRSQAQTIERLAQRHGAVRVEMCLRDGLPWAYVREPWGERYDVPPHGMAQTRLNNDMAPYEAATED
jgi:hypothetical protein